MKHRVGVVGCGWNSIGVHLPVWKALSSRVELVGVYDINQEACKRVASSFNVLPFKDYQDLLESNVNIVDICTPTQTHFPLSKEAILKGKHVLTEKPLLTSQEGRELIELAKLKRVKFGVVQHYIYSKVMDTVRSIISKGVLGKPLHYEISYPIANLKSYPNEWFVREENGGLLWELGIHPSYIIASLMGKPERVIGLGRLPTTRQFCNFTIFLEKGEDSASIRLCPLCSQSYMLSVNGPVGRLRGDLLTEAVTMDRNWFSSYETSKQVANIRLNTTVFSMRSASAALKKALQSALVGPKCLNQFRLFEAFVKHVAGESNSFLSDGETAVTAIEILESAYKDAIKLRAHVKGTRAVVSPVLKLEMADVVSPALHE